MARHLEITDISAFFFFLSFDSACGSTCASAAEEEAGKKGAIDKSAFMYVFR